MDMLVYLSKLPAIVNKRKRKDCWCASGKSRNGLSHAVVSTQCNKNPTNLKFSELGRIGGYLFLLLLRRASCECMCNAPPAPVRVNPFVNSSNARK
jgi:hypothetical protein